MDRDEGTTSLTRLAKHLESVETDAIIAVLWPGDSFAGPLGYSWEGRDADDTAVELVKFIQRTWPVPSRLSLSFVAHSKGCRVAMETAAGWCAETGERVENLCLMAGAIDDDCLSGQDRYADVVRGAGRVTVLASRSDRILAYAYPLGGLLQAFLFLDDEASFALGFLGPKPVGANRPVPSSVVPIQISRSRAHRHSDYLSPSGSFDIPLNKK